MRQAESGVLTTVSYLSGDLGLGCSNRTMDMSQQIRQDNRIVRINKQEEKFNHGYSRINTDKNKEKNVLTQNHKDTEKN